MRKPWLQIDLDVLKENVRIVRDAVGPSSEVIFVVKSNAYNHGAIPVATAAYHAGMRWFGVAYLDEALELRRVLDKPGLLVMGVVEPGDVPTLVQHRITPIVVSLEHGRALGDAALAARTRLSVHFKIDTGMGRLGVHWKQAAKVYGQLLAHPGLQIDGIMSHFATVEPGRPESAIAQAERFTDFDRRRRRIDPRPVMRHLSSSRAMLYYQEWDFDAVRPGIALYGYGTQDSKMRASTRPFLEWKSNLVQVKKVPAGFQVGYYSTYTTERPTTIGTVCAGYTDGFLRTLSKQGIVLVGGKRCRVAGRVSMNWLTVDLGRDSTAQAGDEVVLIGRQGDEEIWAGELARLCRTIPYEILTNIAYRTEPRYLSSAGDAEPV